MKEIQIKYNEKIDEVDVKIKLLQQIVIKHNTDFKMNSNNWGYVGDVSYINDKLDDIISFFNL